MTKAVAIEDVLDTRALTTQTIENCTIHTDSSGSLQYVPSAVTKSFNSRADSYDQDSQHVQWNSGEITAGLHKRYRQSVPERFRPDATSSTVKIFEVGSANGYSVAPLRQSIEEEGLQPVVFGSDIAEKMLVKGIELKRLEYGVQAGADILRLAQSGGLDVVSAIGVSQYFNDHDLGDFAEHCHNALREGGSVNFSWALLGSAGLKQDRRYSTEEVISAFKENALDISGDPLELDKAWRFWKDDKPFIANGFATFYKA